MSSDIDILISEVGPRDGLQNTKQFMPTAYKKKWISAAAAAGLREIEVCSFVPPQLIPQMADAAEIVAHALTIPGLHVAALAPNFKGAQRAMQAGVHKLTLTISVSTAHSLANVRMTPDEAIASAKKICDFRASLPAGKRPKIESGLSTVFGCTIEGKVDPAAVIRLAEKFMEAGADELSVADTVGYANPAQVKSLLKTLFDALGKDVKVTVHLHDTRGLGIANANAALRHAGIDAEQAKAVTEMDSDSAQEAAMTFAKRKRLGPFGSPLADAKARSRAFSAFVRAGHSYEFARKILNIEPDD